MMIPVLADAGLPMLALEWPLMLFALVPVILMEMYVAKRLLALPFKRSWKAVTDANVLSTVIGFPLLWFLLLVVQLFASGGDSYGLHSTWTVLYAVIIQAPWLIPYEEDLYWMVPIAGLYLLLPSFFVSVYSERFIYLRSWKELPKEKIMAFSWRSNACTYALLVLIWLVLLVYNVIHSMQ